MEIALEKTGQIGIVLACAGLIALIFLLPELQTIDISEVGKETLGQRAKFYGTIRNLEIRNGNAFFTLENGASATAVFFNPESEELAQILENRTVQAIGTVSSYRGSFELVVEKVRGID